MIEEMPRKAKRAEEIREELPNIRKQVEVGYSTIDGMLEVLLPQSGLTYNLTTQNGDRYLRIKLKCHRCIVIKLLPTMDMSKLSTLLSTISKVQEAINQVGNLNLAVRNYGNDIQWHSDGKANL